MSGTKTVPDLLGLLAGGMMPTAGEIVASLETIANNWRWLAVFWHGYFAVLILTLVFGVRPSRRTVGVLLAVPLLSVSTLAWIHGNTLSGVLFGIAAIVLIFVSLRLSSVAVHIGPPWLVAVGALMAGFGWVYPHFLVDSEPVQYLYSAPTGLVPCPTTSIVIGLSLVVGGLGSRAWCLTLAIVGLFYGAFGAVRLGVSIDWILFAGALLMAYVGIFHRSAGGPIIDAR